jgi:hypothetical protein
MVNILKEPRFFFGIDSDNVPQWFMGLDGMVQLVVAIIALILGLYAFKIYRLSGKKRSLHFGLGFLFISISYLVWAVLNMAVISNASRILCKETHICIIDILIDVSVYIYMLLFMIGLLLLTYSILKRKSIETYSLLFVIIILVLLFSKKVLFFFYLLSTILLLYLVFHHLRNYFTHKNPKVLIAGSAFFLLSIASLEFIFGLTDGFNYTAGNILTLAAFLLIIYNFLLVLKK